MKRRIVLFILIIFIFACNHVNEKKGCCFFIKGNKQDINVVWRYGVVFINNKAVCFVPSKSEHGQIVVTDDFRINYKNEIVKAGVLTFYTDSCELCVADKKKIDVAWDSQIFETQVIYDYKIIDYVMYLKRKNETIWEPVEIEYIKDIEIQRMPGFAIAPCMVIRLKTKWFSGEYYVFC